MFNEKLISAAFIFFSGLVIGCILMSVANKADLLAQDETIANLEQKAKSLPIVTIDALGICSVKQGGKSYMLIDVTNELRGIEDVEGSYRATEQEIEKEAKKE